MEHLAPNQHTNLTNKLPDDTIVVDLQSIPDGWNIEQWFSLAKTQGIMVIDSSKGGLAPSMLHPRRELEFRVIDTTEGPERIGSIIHSYPNEL